LTLYRSRGSVGYHPRRSGGIVGAIPGVESPRPEAVPELLQLEAI